MPNTARHVDDEPAAPYQATFNDVLIESFRWIGGNRVLTYKPEELTEAEPTFGPSRHGEGWTFNEVHRRQLWTGITCCNDLQRMPDRYRGRHAQSVLTGLYLASQCNGRQTSCYGLLKTR